MLRLRCFSLLLYLKLHPCSFCRPVEICFGFFLNTLHSHLHSWSVSVARLQGETPSTPLRITSSLFIGSYQATARPGPHLFLRLVSKFPLHRAPAGRQEHQSLRSPSSDLRRGVSPHPSLAAEAARPSCEREEEGEEVSRQKLRGLSCDPLPPLTPLLFSCETRQTLYSNQFSSCIWSTKGGFRSAAMSDCRCSEHHVKHRSWLSGSMVLGKRELPLMLLWTLVKANK